MTEPDASGSNDASAVNDVAPAMAPATAATSSSEPMQPSSESEGQAAAPAGTGAGTGQTQIAEGSATTDAQDADAQENVPAAAVEARGRLRKDDHKLKELIETAHHYGCHTPRDRRSRR